jgi:hypothetical protein
MNRRALIKAILCSPFAFLLGKSKTEAAFDPEKSYGDGVDVGPDDDIYEARGIVMKNATLVVPEEYWGGIRLRQWSISPIIKDGKGVIFVSWAYTPEPKS